MAYQPWGSRTKHGQPGRHVAATPGRGREGVMARQPRGRRVQCQGKGDTARRASRWRRNEL
eukprot:8913176-Alexandrium_andersonii.AAC.1